VKILDIASGQTPKLTSAYMEIEVVACDIQPNEAVELQDMEKLTYPDDSFDLVICINALDHTRDAHEAVRQMLRVSKGPVYINCALNQMTRHRKKHYWDAKEDGTLINKDNTVVNLHAFGFDVECVDGRMIARNYA
jgi:ubiquinone/menaquinone biosynthesis C-methylase UbiE